MLHASGESKWGTVFLRPDVPSPRAVLQAGPSRGRSFRQVSWLLTQVVLAVLTTLDGMNEHLIGRLYLLEMIPPMLHLAALVPQALWGTHKTIGGRRQTALVAIFGLLPFERSHVLVQGPEWP